MLIPSFVRESSIRIQSHPCPCCPSFLPTLRASFWNSWPELRFYASEGDLLELISMAIATALHIKSLEARYRYHYLICQHSSVWHFLGWTQAQRPPRPSWVYSNAENCTFNLTSMPHLEHVVSYDYWSLSNVWLYPCGLKHSSFITASTETVL